MKASLLLMGLTTGMMAVGAAHAANTAGHTHMSTLRGQVLAAAPTSSDGLLSTLRNLLSSDQGAHAHAADHADSAAARDSDTRTGAADQAIRGTASPGPVGQASTGTARAGDDIPHPADNLGDAAAVHRPAPALGWQSLLPGSIQ